jgi:hypothetical protein
VALKAGRVVALSRMSKGRELLTRTVSNRTQAGAHRVAPRAMAAARPAEVLLVTEGPWLKIALKAVAAPLNSSMAREMR